MTTENLTTVLYVHSSDEMYGSDKVLLQLVDGIDKQHFRPIVVLPTDISYDGLLTQALRERGIKVIHLKLAVLRRKYFGLWGFLVYFSRLVKSTIAIAEVIREEHINFVQSNTLAVIPGALAAKLMRKPHIWHVHEIIVRPKFVWRTTSWLAPTLSDVVVAVSRATHKHLCLGDKRNVGKSIVINNSLDAKSFANASGSGTKVREEWKISSDQLLIGMIGRISHWKGQDYFLKVASLVKTRCPGVKFAIVGGTLPGQGEKKGLLKKLAVDLGLSTSVIFSDFRLDIPAVLDALDILVFPSILPDPFGIVVLEAMAVGRPVVANAHGGCTEIIKNGITGLLVPPGQPEVMADAVLYLIRNSAVRESMGKAGRKRLQDYFSMDIFISKWEQLYESLVSPHTQAIRSGN